MIIGLHICEYCLLLAPLQLTLFLLPMTDLLDLASFSAAPLVTLTLSIERSIPRASLGSISSILVVGVLTLGLRDWNAPVTVELRARRLNSLARGSLLADTAEVVPDGAYFVVSLTALAVLTLPGASLRSLTNSLGRISRLGGLLDGGFGGAGVIRQTSEIDITVAGRR